MKELLESRGLWRPWLQVHTARQLLLRQPDLAFQKRKIEVVLDKKFGPFKRAGGVSRATILWLPQYHCELNPIERPWNMMKNYARRYNCENMSVLTTPIDGTLSYALRRIDAAHLNLFIGLADRWLDYYHSLDNGEEVEQLVPPQKIRLVGYLKAKAAGLASEQELSAIVRSASLSLRTPPPAYTAHLATLQSKPRKQRGQNAKEAIAQLERELQLEADGKDVARERRKRKVKTD